jgi:MFS family permease
MGRDRLRLGLLALTQLIVALDYNIVYVALPDIGDALDFSPRSVQWVVSAYSVGLGGLLLFGGRAADRLGPRRMFMTGLALYGTASLVGGLAHGSGMLVAARAVQGAGGALLTPATLTLIYRGFAEGPARNRALGTWGMAGSAGLAAGSLLGGVLTNYLGWEWVFFVNVPLALGCVLAAPRLLPTDPGRTSGGFDVPGAVLATAGSTLLVLGLANGPDAGWVSLRSTGALAAGAVLLALLLTVEARTRDPLIPLRLALGRNLATTMIVIAVFQGTLGGGYYILTSYLQPVLGYSSLEAGLTFLPLTLVCMLAALKVTPVLLGRWGIRTTLAVSTIGTGAGIAVMVAGTTPGGRLLDPATRQRRLGPVRRRRLRHTVRIRRIRRRAAPAGRRIRAGQHCQGGRRRGGPRGLRRDRHRHAPPAARPARRRMDGRRRHRRRRPGRPRPPTLPARPPSPAIPHP